MDQPNHNSTYFVRRYSSRTVRTFCAGALSVEKAARLAMLEVDWRMLGPMRWAKIRKEFILGCVSCDLWIGGGSLWLFAWLIRCLLPCMVVWLFDCWLLLISSSFGSNLWASLVGFSKLLGCWFYRVTALKPICQLLKTSCKLGHSWGNSYSPKHARKANHNPAHQWHHWIRRLSNSDFEFFPLSSSTWMELGKTSLVMLPLCSVCVNGDALAHDWRINQKLPPTASGGWLTLTQAQNLFGTSLLRVVDSLVCSSWLLLLDHHHQPTCNTAGRERSQTPSCSKNTIWLNYSKTRLAKVLIKQAGIDCLPSKQGEHIEKELWTIMIQ